MHIINHPDERMTKAQLHVTDPGRHIIIGGPTASGKSALALAIARQQGGVIVNADALQVWSCWRVLTARPSAEDETAAEHALYGHVSPDRSYSVGDWLREVAALRSERLIIVGGTGLYLTALTQGLADIPPVRGEIRAEADALVAQPGGVDKMLRQLDPATRNRIDNLNPVRVQRAWEVLRATGRGLAEWQADTPPPLIGSRDSQRILVTADRAWLAERIAVRFRQMLSLGVTGEVRAMLSQWDETRQWTRAIGARELAASLRGGMDPETAAQAAIIATRQYAKMQRSWFRSRMKDWEVWPAESILRLPQND